jgi:hypothetical protein
MIITSEVAKNLRTTKFIPVLRGGENLPAFMADRLYLDARNSDTWEAQYTDLIAELKRSARGDTGNASAAASRESAARLNLVRKSETDAVNRRRSLTLDRRPIVTPLFWVFGLVPVANRRDPRGAE